jgi:hypothetical protein
MTRRIPEQHSWMVVWLAVVLLATAVTGCSDDATSPRYTETYLLAEAPEPIRGGRLVLEYARDDIGRVWYGLDHPHTTEFGTFRRQESTIELWLRSARRHGTVLDQGREIRLNDGTRWKR